MHRLDDFKSFFSFGIASLIVPLAYILRATLEKENTLDPAQVLLISFLAMKFYFQL